ncbi:MAG: DUF1761 domain-containing protein [Gemmatimonadetes bacterium]|nr:DUF1761 domain-containing protein [Gemmatimonadota bacterium]
MDLNSAVSGVNYLAVLVAAVAVYVLRTLWYSPAFLGKLWMAASGLTEEKTGQGNPGLIFGVSFLLELVAAFVLALFIGAEGTFSFGLQTGFLAGLFWVSTALGVVYLFERRSLRLWLLNAGYLTLAFTVMGGILGVWS